MPSSEAQADPDAGRADAAGFVAVADLEKLRALDFKPDEAHEIVIVGNPDDEDTWSLLHEVHRRLLHGTVLAVIAPDAPPENEKWLLLAARPLLDDKPTAYVCRKRLCNLPVNTPTELSAQLDKLVSQVSAP